MQLPTGQLPRMPPRAETPRVRRPLRAVVRDVAGGRVVTVPPYAAGDRLDGFLQRHGDEPERSRSEWQRLIGDEAVLLNGLPSKPSQRVLAGDRVLISPKPRHLELPPDDQVPFEVVYPPMLDAGDLASGMGPLVQGR